MPSTDPPSLIAPSVRADPYPLYAQLRSEPSVQRIAPNNIWAVTRYTDVMEVLKDTGRFSSNVVQPTLPAWMELNSFQKTMVSMDPPNHTRLRALVNPAFTAASLGRLGPLIRRRADDLARGLVEAGESDLLTRFGQPLSLFVLRELMGLDPALDAQYKDWSDDVVRTSARVFVPVGGIRKIRQSFRDMEEHFAALIVERRSRPREDLISVLVQAKIEGEPLTQEQLLGFIGLLLVSGLESPADFLSLTIRILCERPELFRRVRADRRLIPKLMDEVLRFDPPVQGVIRRASTDTELGGAKIPRNASLFVAVASALRDPQYVDQPDTFSLDREKPTALSFGHGVHFCLGTVLTRMEAEAALESFFDQVAEVGLTSTELQWKEAITIRGPTSLPVRVSAA